METGDGVNQVNVSADGDLRPNMPAPTIRIDEESERSSAAMIYTGLTYICIYIISLVSRLYICRNTNYSTQPTRVALGMT